MSDGKKYLKIVGHYEACLERHGDSHLGVDWPCREDTQTRYRVMLEAIRCAGPVSLLDLGCGASHLYEYILAHSLQDRIAYSGLDLSPQFVALSRRKFPDIDYYCVDLLEDAGIPDFDYIVMNGLFTEKCDLSYSEMQTYFESMVQRAFSKARVGIAFNVMSTLVDWTREDLFHVPFDPLASFLAKHVSRHFVVRHDYRLYEYTVYVYR